MINGICEIYQNEIKVIDRINIDYQKFLLIFSRFLEALQ